MREKLAFSLNISRVSFEISFLHFVSFRFVDFSFNFFCFLQTRSKLGKISHCFIIKMKWNYCQFLTSFIRKKKEMLQSLFTFISTPTKCKKNEWIEGKEEKKIKMLRNNGMEKNICSNLESCVCLKRTK
jgi:hypothetical protein